MVIPSAASLALLAAVSVGVSDADVVLDPDHPYTATVSNPVTYNISFSLVFTPPYHTRKAAVWMVRPSSLPGQGVSNYAVTPAPTGASVDPLYGIPLNYFQLDEPSGGQVISPCSALRPCVTQRYAE